MPAEVKAELMRYAKERGLASSLALKASLTVIFDDDTLKMAERAEREEVLHERSRIMRHYAANRAYLYHDEPSGLHFIKGVVFYPAETTMRANIASYLRIVLDQSFNLGKNVFGTQPEAVPFTFRSDGTVQDGRNVLIQAGDIIHSRPWGEDDVGTTPMGLVEVNSDGEPVDEDGNRVDLDVFSEKVKGHVSTGGTFETRYNPILSDRPLKAKKNRAFTSESSTKEGKEKITDG